METPLKDYASMSMASVVREVNVPIWMKIARFAMGLMAVMVILDFIFNGDFTLGKMLGRLTVPIIVILTFRDGNRSKNVSIPMNLQLYDDKIVVVYGAIDYGDGLGVRVRSYELLMTNLKRFDYNHTTSTIRLVGNINIYEYENDKMYQIHNCIRERPTVSYMNISIESFMSDEIVQSLENITGKKCAML